MTSFTIIGLLSDYPFKRGIKPTFNEVFTSMFYPFVYDYYTYSKEESKPNE